MKHPYFIHLLSFGKLPKYTLSRKWFFSILLLVLSVAEAISQNEFITTWRTTAANESITIPTGLGTFDYAIDWGDGTVEMNQSTDAVHSYASPGDHTVKISGQFPHMRLSNLLSSGGNSKLIGMEQWGNIAWGSLNGMFANATNMAYNATDAPDLSVVTDAVSVFGGVQTFNTDLNNWDVSNISVMTSMFSASGFNGDISDWDVSNVVRMAAMFSSSEFNGDISGWNVMNVTDMSAMFSRSDFNGDITGWDVSNVTDMEIMFAGATAFNQAIGTWDVSSVTNMFGLFSTTFGNNSPVVFNQDIGGWDVSAVTNMGRMFQGNTVFNQNIGNWDVANVTNMLGMFGNASNFNQPIGNWNVSKVTDMTGMFSSTVFNQDIGNWGVSAVVDMQNMFFGNTAFNQNLDAWNVENVINMIGMFRGASSFDQPLGNWDVKGAKLASMFFGATLFNQDISGWDLSETDSIGSIFRDATSFNQPINDWDVSNVTDMNFAFHNATAFDQPLDSWDVSACEDFSRMFEGGTYNRDISNWNVSAGKDFGNMFAFNGQFNQNISDWDVSAAEDMTNMFSFAFEFNQSLASWDISNVTSMASMFRSTGLSIENYDQTLAGWASQTVQSGINLDATGLRYCDGTARSKLINDFGWTIVDSGSRCLVMTDAVVDNSTQITVSYLVNVQVLEERTRDFFVTDAFFNTYETIAVSDDIAGDNKIVLTVQDFSSAVGDLNIRYRNNANAISDADTGMEFKQNDFSGVFADLDNTAPTMVSAEANAATQITLLLSEIVQTEEGEPGDFVLTDINGNTFDVTGLADNEARDNELILTTVDFSGAILPLILTYTNDNLQVSDFGNNELATDAVGIPVALNAPNILRATRESNTLVRVTYDRNVQTNEGNPMDFTLTDEANNNYPVSAQVDEVAGDTDIVLTVADISGATGDVRLTYTNNNNEISQYTLSALVAPTDAVGVIVQRGFVTTWQTTSANETIFIPINEELAYDYRVDWGDGTVDNGQTGIASHSYATAGTHTVTITGLFPHFFMDNFNVDFNNRSKLLTVEQWGDQPWISMEGAFRDTENFTITATDAPDLSGLTSMENMFAGTTSFNQSINHWDVSNVTNMKRLFNNAVAFNQPLDNWNVGQVTTMEQMFKSADVFNQNISMWDVSSVTDMSGMFEDNAVYNQPLNGWNVSKVENMRDMFEEAEVFNQDLDQWDVSSVTNMEDMFYEAFVFNGNVSTWNVSNVLTTDEMFRKAKAFNQDLNNWDVSNLMDINSMFEEAITFNGNISDWNVSSVYDFGSLFENATVFNQDISGWDVSSMEVAGSMFNEAEAFNQDISGWNVSNLNSAGFMFLGATSFNQDISSWNITNLEHTNEMFKQAEAFDQNLGSWDIQNFSDADEMLDNSGLSWQNYDATLVGWAANANVPQDLNIGSKGLFYSPVGVVARQTLIDTHGWTINGDTPTVHLTGGLQVNDTEIVLEFSKAITLQSANTADFSLQDANGTVFQIVSVYDPVPGDEFVNIGFVNQSEVFGDFEVSYINNSNAIVAFEDPTELAFDETVSVSRPFITTWNVADDGMGNTSLTLPVGSNVVGAYELVVNWGDASTEKMTHSAGRFLTVLEDNMVSFAKTDFADPGLEVNQDRITTDVWLTRGDNQGLFNYNEETSFSGSTATIEWANGPTIEMGPSDYGNFQRGVGFNARELPGRTISLHLINEDRYFDLTFTEWTARSGGGFGYTRVEVSSSASLSHDYAQAGEYTVSLSGEFTTFTIANGPQKDQLLSVNQWGNINWSDMANAFQGATNMTDGAGDKPLVGGVSNFDGMFDGASAFNADLGAWDVSAATTMVNMLDNSGLSRLNYDRTLIGWESQTVQNGVSLGATGLNYCLSATERTNLMNNSGWTIMDAGELCIPVMASATKDSDTQITVSFDQNVVTAGTNPSDFIITDGAGNNIAVSNQSDGTAGDTDIVLTTADLSTALGDLVVTYQNNNNGISGLANGDNVATDNTGVAIDTDTTAPTLISATKDSDTQITVGFSEALQITGATATDFTVVDLDGIAFAVTALSDGTAQDNELVLSITDIGTAVGRLTITYANNNNGIRDFGGNTMATDLTGIEILLDVVPPTVILSSTVTGPVNSAFDLNITFSEEVTGFALTDLIVVNGSAGNFMGTGSDYTVTITPTSDGTITVDIPVAVAQDAARNDNIAAAQFSIEADITAPDVPVVTRISDDTGADAADGITNDPNLILNGTAEANSTVEIFIDAISLGTTTTDGAGAWSLDHSSVSLAEGNYNITAIATDAAGNTSLSSVVFIVEIDTTTPSQPVFGGISDDNGFSNTDFITNDRSIIFSGTAEPLSTAGVLFPGGNTRFTTTDASGNWVLDFSNRDFFDGTYSFSVTTTDPAGNTSAMSNVINLIIDTVTPDVASIARADANPTTASSVDFTVTFSEEVHGLNTSNFELVLTDTQNADIASVSATSGTSVTVTVNNITGSGTFGLNLSDVTGITDVAGNNMTATFTGEVYNTNFFPTDITLSASNILENNTIGDAVSTLTTADNDAGDSHTYSLVSGTGDTHNASFSISGDQLLAAEVFDLETQASYDIRIQTDDGRGGTFEEAFTITIDNVAEAFLRITGDGNVPATPLGITANFDVTIHNDGDASLIVANILYPDPVFGGPVSGITVAPMSNEIVSLSFTPAIAQVYTGDITFITNGGTGILSVSADGAIITSIDNGQLKAEAIKLYPNPANDIVTIDLSNYNGHSLDIQMFNLSGTKTFEVNQFNQPELRLDVRDYQNGLYLMQFSDGKNVVQKKVMIRK